MSFIDAFSQQLNSLNLLSPERDVNDKLAKSERNRPLVIAYSGGLDSHVLLHACHTLKLPVRAVHVHHGLQKSAGDWVAHCQQVCKRLKINLDVLYIDATAKPRQSPEEAARISRYAALKAAMQPGEQLLTAQHADDQSETFLLQLMRGASAAGLSAMPAQRSLGDVIHKRPLLSFGRNQIEAYAIENQLKWIEDPSNQNTAFDRNFIRQNVLPVLKQRWPVLNRKVAHTVALQQENLEILDAMAAVDLATVSTQNQNQLSISRLLQLSNARLKNTLRYWINCNTDDQATRNLLEEIYHGVLSASDDAKPCVKWGRSELRRYQNNLYLLPQREDFDSSQCILWPAGSKLAIAGVGTLSRQEKPAWRGLKQAYLGLPLTVRFRQGGERLRLVGQPQSRRLKSLLQEAEMPPWQRQRLPLIYCEDTLIAVSDLWIADGSEAAEGELSWLISIDA